MDKIKQLLSNVSKEIGDVVTELDGLHQQYDSFSVRLDNLSSQADHFADFNNRQLDINNSQISINDLRGRADNEFDSRLSAMEATVQSINITMDEIINRLDRVPIPVDPGNPDTTTPPRP